MVNEKGAKKHLRKTSLCSDMMAEKNISIVMRSDDLNSVVRPTSKIINRRTF